MVGFAMKVKTFRLFGATVVLSTVCAFLWFSHMHPEVVGNLKQTTALTIVAIVAMYAGSIFSLAFILAATVQLFGKNLPYSEYLLLTAYSSLANFFGPGQSGPGVRAVYLKVKHGIDFKHFLFATFVYFAWLVLISGAMLIASSVPWWLMIAFITATGAAGAFVIWRITVPNRTVFVPLECKPRLVRMVLTTGIGTALQIAFITAAYFAELYAVDSSVTLSQAISFTGAANFSLFVSITPGAIGIREAFLFFSQNIHGVSTETIASASALDRAVYFVVLGLLGLLVLLTHAGQRFRQLMKAKSQGNL
jgi:uncharacterized membrane protein YbhN (UPF0104 family)